MVYSQTGQGGAESLCFGALRGGGEGPMTTRATPISIAQGDLQTRSPALISFGMAPKDTCAALFYARLFCLRSTPRTATRRT